MRPRAPWSGGSMSSRCTSTKAAVELHRPVRRVSGQQQRALVQQLHQQQQPQQAQQLNESPNLQTATSQVRAFPHFNTAGFQPPGVAGSSTVEHLPQTVPAAGAQQQETRHQHTSAGRWQQHDAHHYAQQQPQDMHPSDLAAAFLKLLKQQQAAAGQLPAHHACSSSSSSLPALHTTPPPPPPAAALLGDERYYQQLLQHTQLLLPHLQPRQASLILYAAAKLGRPPGPQLLAALLQQRLQEQQLQLLPPAGLTNVLWALAVIGYSPGQQWMAGFYASSSSGSSTTGSSSSTSTSTSISTTTGSSSSSSSSGGMAGLNRHQLCSLLWSLGSLQERPPAEWLQQLLAALRPHLQQLQPSELTSVLWGLSQLRYRPGKGWAKEWFSASSRVLGYKDSEASALTEDSSLGSQGSRLQHSSGQERRQAERSQQGSGFSPDHLACVAGSLGFLRLDPRSGHWLRSFRRCVVTQLPRMRGSHVATVLCGLAKRRSSQPPHWVWLLVARQLQLLEMQQRLVLQQRLAPPAAGQGVAEDAARQGTAAPAQQPAASTAAAAAAAANHATAQRQLQPADIAATVWSLPRLLYPTAAHWAAQPAHSAALKALAAACLPLLPCCSAAELVQLAVGFAGLRFYPGAHWLKVHENAVAARYAGMSAANRARLRAAVRVMWCDG